MEAKYRSMTTRCKVLFIVTAICGCLAEGMAQTDVTLTSNLYEGNIAYNAQNITFRCITCGVGTTLYWISDDYIGSSGAVLEFASVHDPGRTETSSTNPTTTAVLINTTTDTNTRVTEIISELSIIASLRYPNSSISCRVNGNGPENTTMFRIVPHPGPPRINSTLNGEDACPGNEISFECITVDSQNLTWMSEDYISPDAPLYFLSTSPTKATEERSGTYAMLMNKSIDNGRIRLTSTLTITVSESIRESMSHFVTCLNVDVGTNTTISFQLNESCVEPTFTVTSTDSKSGNITQLAIISTVTVTVPILIIIIIIVVLVVIRYRCTRVRVHDSHAAAEDQNNTHLKKYEYQTESQYRPKESSEKSNKYKLVPSTVSSSSSISSSSKSMSNSLSTTSTMTTISAASAQSQGEQNIKSGLSGIPEETDRLSTVTESCNDEQVQEQDNLSTCTQTISCKDAPVKESPTKTTPSDSTTC